VAIGVTDIPALLSFAQRRLTDHQRYSKAPLVMALSMRSVPQSSAQRKRGA
jgi:hypothetical protein